MAMGIAGPQPPAPDRSGHRQTVGEVPSAVGTAGPQRQDRRPDAMSQYKRRYNVRIYVR